MKLHELEENLSLARSDMKEQTGKVTGGETDRCHPLVIGSLTGKRQNYVNLPKNFFEQRSRERSSGLIAHQIFPIKIDTLSALRSTLEQTHLPLDAVLVDGVVRTSDSMHIIAVVPTPQESHAFHIVDSLTRRALLPHESVNGVVDYVDSEFEPGFFLRAVPLRNGNGHNIRGATLRIIPTKLAKGVYILSHSQKT